MKVTGLIIIACTIIFSGVTDIFKYKKNTLVLNEIIMLITLFKNEIRYKKSSFNELYESGKEQNYKTIIFKNNSIFLPEITNKKIKLLFKSFIDKIGTTDENGQISICDSYTTVFSELLNNQKLKEKSKTQVNLSLSLLSALCVVIIFI